MADKQNLSKEQAEIWDRLKNGIPPRNDFEGDLIKHLAEEIKKEIDAEIIADLTDMAKQMNPGEPT